MKNTLSAIIIILSGMGIAINTHAANRLYIVPADADGIIEKDSTGYKGQMEMVQDSIDGNKFTVSNVNLDNGSFAIYAINEDNGLSTFYGPLSWAVTPLPVNYPSPLSITRNGETVKLPATGTYDFEFYDRDIEGITYHMLIPKPISVEADVKYPAKLFLVTSDDRFVELDGDPATGIYQGTMIVPEDFKISYEPKFGSDAFIFGPTSATSDKVIWHDNEKIPIEYIKGTNAVFEAEDQVRASEYSNVLVNLAEGYLMINKEVVVGIEELGINSEPVKYYSLSGTRLMNKPESGLYIRVEGGHAIKQLAR